MEKITFSGEFNLLDYNISHKVALFRRTKVEGPNLDLIFEGVFYFEIARRLEGIEIRDASESESLELSNKASGKVFSEFNEKFLIINSGD